VYLYAAHATFHLDGLNSKQLTGRPDKSEYFFAGFSNGGASILASARQPCQCLTKESL